MKQYIARRVAMIAPMTLGITLISFFIIKLAPGDPTELASDLNPTASVEAIKAMRELYHLDEPIAVQYWLWLKRVAMLDFGASLTPDARPVMEKIAERLPVTISINLATMLITLLLSIPIGVIAASRPYGLFDKASTLFVFVGFSAPGFWVALLMMILFGVHLGWAPISGLVSNNHAELTFLGKLLDYFWHLLMPVLISALTGLAFLARLTRQSVLESISAEYMRAARAKGITERAALFRHALRNALLPLITTLGMSLPALIGGSVIFETVFAIPGFGQLFFQAVFARDYPLVMASLVIGSFLTLIGNLLADVAYALADPRISYD